MTAASIIITSYNYARFLPETIASALAQTLPEVEVIVIDDGSTDDSREVIASFGDRITAVLKPNGGQASAFNTGFARSSGEFVCFLDSDDLILPTALERTAQLFSDPEVAKVNWPLWLIDERGERTGAILPPIENVPDGDFRERVLAEGPFYDWNITPPTSGNAWSRRFLDQIFPIPEPEYRTCADEYLLTLAPIFGSVKKISEPLGCYRAHGGNHGWQRALDDEKIARDLGRLELSCEILAKFLRDQGVAPDVAGWKERNFNYQWMDRLRRVKRDLLSITSPGDVLILVDEYEWGGQILPARQTVSLVERDGEYARHPTDDAAAIDEFQRLQSEGARWIVFWWTAQWWFERYPGFIRYLRERFRCVADNNALVVFDLRAPLPLEQQANS